MILKICALLLLYLTYVKAIYSEHEMLKVIKDLADECVNKFPFDESIKEDVNNHRKWADDENFKCYLHCMMKEGDILTEDGDIDEDACIAYLADNYRDEFIPIIRRCGTKKGATVCDTAWLTNQCWAQGPRYRVL